MEVSVSPNPATRYFTLQIKSSSDNVISINVVDAMGRLMEAKQNNGNTNIRFGQEYKPGIYYAEVIQGAEKKIVKLVKSM